jgi:hypothetical protein
MDRFELAKLIDDIIKKNYEKVSLSVIRDALRIELSLYSSDY